MIKKVLTCSSCNRTIQTVIFTGMTSFFCHYCKEKVEIMKIRV